MIDTNKYDIYYKDALFSDVLDIELEDRYVWGKIIDTIVTIKYIDSSGKYQIGTDNISNFKFIKKQ